MGSVLRVRDVMSRAPKTLGRNEQLSLADDLMKQERIRHLPVLDDDGELVGIVSQRDMFRGALARALGYGETAQRRMLGLLAVKEVMTTQVVTVEPDAPIADAARTMVDRKIGCLPVVEGGRLVGILTESDFVEMLASRGKLSSRGARA
jgi:CBS domain-containing membrane protein